MTLPPGPSVPPPLLAAGLLAAQQPILRRFHRRYGDAFSLRVPEIGQCVFVSDPDLIKQVFTASPDVLYGGEGNPLGVILGPGSFFALDGDRHRRQRKLLLPPFHGERMKGYESIIEEEALREMATWPSNTPFKTTEPMMRITLNAILRAVFGAQGSELSALRDLLPAMVTLGSRLALMPFAQRDLGRLSPWGRFQRQRRRYDAAIDGLISQTLADPAFEERSDVLALMLQARYEDGTPMERRDVADQLLTLLAAGHETTAGQLSWTVERLRRHPTLLQRLVDEACSGGGELRQATIYESQRTRPTIALTARRAHVAFELGEWTVPPAATVFVPVSIVHMDDRIYKDAASFNPDRFLGRKPGTYTWLPFGGGTRRCIGAAFANMEMDVVLRTLLTRFELATTKAPAERWHHRGIAFAPARGGLAVLRPRRSAVSHEDESARRALPAVR